MPVRQILPDIFQITMPTPFAVGDVHAYLLWGEPLTLVDTGLFYPPGEAALRAALAEIGVQPSNLQQIILTHSHLDHMGQAGWLKAEGGADVFAHPHACDKVADLMAYAQQGYAWSANVLAETGLPAEKHATLQAFYAIIPRMALGVQVDSCLDEGDEIKAGDRAWRVLFCPGHAGDLICLHDAAERLLIGNDHLLGHISSNALLEPPRQGRPARRMPLIEYWRSLDRLETLAIDSILPGHGEVVTDHVGLLARRRAGRDRRLARIEALTAAAPLTVWQISQALFPKLTESDVFLALSEVIGHLDMLTMQGRVERVLADAPFRYRAY